MSRKNIKSQKVLPNNNAIKQRWNGLGHHIAFFVHNNTDIFVISIFLGLNWVSVYSVYYMIASGIKNIVIALIGGVESAFGNMIARNEVDALNLNFNLLETLSSILIVLFFTVTGLLLLDFIKIYTAGINDVQYLILPFGVLMTVSEALQCIKSPYNSVILAAGHYKETQIGAYIEAAINVIFSIFFVYFLGIIGVMIATISATVFRIINYMFYLKKHILCRKIAVFMKRQMVNLANILIILGICILIPFQSVNTYFDWVLKALYVFIIAVTVTFLGNIVFYRKEMIAIYNKIKSVFIKKERNK